MLKIKLFTFNPFSENTYILSDDSSECIIIDAGCYTKEEKNEMHDYILSASLKPVRIVMTHAHIDHMLGNNFASARYNIPVQLSYIETSLLNSARTYGEMWGIDAEPSPSPSFNITEESVIEFGQTKLKPIFTPGHSPGSFSFLHEESKSLIAGDVLFAGSIGRTDLPGGDYDTLMKSIKEKLLILNDDITVYPGHGPSTTIGVERRTNPFINQ